MMAFSSARYRPAVVRVEPPPYLAARPVDRARNLAKGNTRLASARDTLGRAGKPALHRIVDDTSDRLATIADQLAAGSITPEQWFRRSLDQIVTAHFAGLGSLNGKLGPDALDALEPLIDRQAGFLDRFRQQIAAGSAGTGAQIVARARMYGAAVWASSMNARNTLQAEKYPLARRMLDDGALSHCTTCPALAAEGWVPSEEIVPIGESECASNCRCWVEWSGGSGAIDTPDIPAVAQPPPPKAPSPPPADSFADLAARLAAATIPSDARQIALDWVASHAAPGDPRPVQAHGMPAPEAMRTIRVGGLTIRFPDLGDRTKSAVADTVRGLARLGDIPPELTKYTREVVLSSARNKDDAYWEKQYGMTDFRATATGSGGKVVVYNGRPLNGGDLAHEMAHNLAEGRWDAMAPPARTDYAAILRAGTEPPVTPYAAKSPAEDFAEAVRFYTENPARLREIAPRRFEVIERMLREPFYGG